MRICHVATVVALAVSLGVGEAAAQTGTITGTVRVRGSLITLDSATVQLSGTVYGAMTRQNGTYNILGVAPGTYTLVARRAGFPEVEISGVVVSAEVVRRQDIEFLPARADTGLFRRVELRAAADSVLRARAGSPWTSAAEDRSVASRPAPPGTRSFEQALFTPEFVMQHQRTIGITADQRRTISDAIRSLQNETVEVQWGIHAEEAALADLLARRPVAEGAAVAQLNKLLELEQRVKRLHLAALVRIKNALTPAQIERLSALRATEPGGR